MLCFWDGVPPPLSIGVGCNRCRSRQCFFLLCRLWVISHLRLWRCLLFQKKQSLSQQRLRKRFPCLLPRCRLMLLFRQNLLRRVSNPWVTRWGYQTWKAWARLRSLLFLVPGRESFVCAPLLSLGFWSVVGQISRSARVTCGCSLVQASGLSLGLAFLHSVSGVLLLPVTKACMRRSGARAGCICFFMLALSVAAICFCLLSAGK